MAASSFEYDPLQASGPIAQQRRSIGAMVSSGNAELYRILGDILAHRPLDLDGWVGVGIGRTGRLAAFLSRADDDVAARFFGLFPTMLEEVDFVVVGGVVPAAAPGDSIGAGVVGGMSGTLGCLLTCNITGVTMALTCDHVVGALAGRSAGDDVWSPGAARGGTTASAIGTFERGSTVLFGGAANRTEAALVALSAPASHSAALPSGAVPTKLATSIALGDRGHKVGVATGSTSGELLYIATLLVPYAGGSAMFVDQFIFDGVTTAFAQLGDSGALVYSNSDEAIGLLFAAAPAAYLGIVNPMAEVLNAVNAHL